MANEANAAAREYLEKLVVKASAGTENPVAPTALTKVSWIFLGLGVTGLLGGVGGFVGAEKLNWGETAQNIGTIAFIVGLLCLAKPIYDAKKPSPASRPDPAKALGAYLSCIEMGWWEGAASCLSWSAKDGGAISREEIAALDLDPITVPVNKPSDLGEFWEILIHLDRKMSHQLQKIARFGENRALVQCQLSVRLDLTKTSPGSRAREGGAMIRNTNIVQITSEWPLYRKDGTWYVLEAGFPQVHRISRQK